MADLFAMLTGVVGLAAVAGIAWLIVASLVTDAGVERDLDREAEELSTAAADLRRVLEGE